MIMTTERRLAFALDQTGHDCEVGRKGSQRLPQQLRNHVRPHAHRRSNQRPWLRFDLVSILSKRLGDYVSRYRAIANGSRITNTTERLAGRVSTTHPDRQGSEIKMACREPLVTLTILS